MARSDDEAAGRQRKEAERHLELMKNMISGLALGADDLSKRDRNFERLASRLGDLPRALTYAPDELRKAIEEVRVLIKPRDQAFEGIARMSCRPGAAGIDFVDW